MKKLNTSRDESYRFKGFLDIIIITVGFIVITPLLGLTRTTDFIIFCIYVLGYIILYGFMGKLSFGHMLYLGTGAYAASLCCKYISQNPFVAIFAGICAGILIGLLLGPIVVRTSGAYFALINLAFNHIGYYFALIRFAEYTGGEDGIAVSFAKLGFIDFNKRPFIFILAFISLLLIFYFLKRLTSSSYGVLIKSIKENETRVKFLGYNTYKYKIVTFVISTTVTAFAGALSILNYGYMTTGFIDPSRNVEVIFAVLIGGSTNLYGAVIGGLVYMTLRNYLSRYIFRWEMFLGFVLLSIVFRFKEGIWGYIDEKISNRERKIMVQKG